MDIKQLLTQFAPYCCFHNEETSFPISFDRVVANSLLLVDAQGKKKYLPNALKELLSTHSPEEIVELWLQQNPKLRSIYQNGKLSLQPFANAEGMQGDFNTKTKTLSALPVHALASEVSLKNEGREELFYRLTYLFIYRDNIPPYAFGAGEHLSDVEHVTIYVRQKENGSWSDQIEKMYFAAHSQLEGTWVSGDKIKYRNGHPVTYIARGSHADYPALNFGSSFFSSTFFVPRVFGFANDQIADHIQYQIREEDIRPLPEVVKKNYDLKIGGGVSINKGFISGPESTLSTNSLIRQLPKQIGSFWDPVDHMSRVNHEERVVRLLDFDMDVEDFEGRMLLA